MTKENLEKRVGIGFKNSVDHGLKIKKEYPEIADFYRENPINRVVEEEFGFADIYGISDSVAIKAIHYALFGYSGGMNNTVYTGLLHESELTELRKKNKQLRMERKGMINWEHEIETPFGNMSIIKYLNHVSPLYRFGTKRNLRELSDHLNGYIFDDEEVVTPQKIKEISRQYKNKVS